MLYTIKVYSTEGTETTYTFPEGVGGEQKFNLCWEVIQELGREEYPDN